MLGYGGHADNQIVTDVSPDFFCPDIINSLSFPMYLKVFFINFIFDYFPPIFSWDQTVDLCHIDPVQKFRTTFY